MRHVVREQQRGGESGADEVARDHHAADRPTIDEHAGDGRDECHRRHVRDADDRDVARPSVQPEGDQADDAEEGEEIAEDADELRDPDGAERPLAQHAA